MSSESVTFSDCLSEFQTNTNLVDQYAYHGSVWNPEPDGIYITKEGCNKICGRAPELHEWKDSARKYDTFTILRQLRSEMFHKV